MHPLLLESKLHHISFCTKNMIVKVPLHVNKNTGAPLYYSTHNVGVPLPEPSSTYYFHSAFVIENARFHVVAKCLFSIVHKFKTVIAIYSLETKYGYSSIIHWKVWVPITSGMGVAFSSTFYYASLWSSNISGKNIAAFSLVEGLGWLIPSFSMLLFSIGKLGIGLGTRLGMPIYTHQE